jgi:hypothetical protein
MRVDWMLPSNEQKLASTVNKISSSSETNVDESWWVMAVKNASESCNSHNSHLRLSCSRLAPSLSFVVISIHYTRKNAQFDAILMKTGLNNVLLPTLFIAVTPDSGSTTLFNIVDKCEQRGQQNIVQYCWQVWTTWAAKHCSVLLSSGLSVFCHV